MSAITAGHQSRAIPQNRHHSGRARGATASRFGGEKILTTPVGLAFPREVALEEWERAGLQLRRLTNSSAWYLGDWLLYGQDKYADRYRRVVDEVGLDYQTLRNYAWVARSFPVPRRRGEVSFQHHAEVASLPPEEQDRWLGLAVEHKWTRNALRKAVQEHRRAGAVPATPAQLPRLTVPTADLERWRTAAAEVDADFRAWVVAVLNDAASAVLADEGDH